MSDGCETAPARYSLFGLQIDSAISLPELFEGAPELPADVTVEIGRIAAKDEFGDGLHGVDGGALLVIDNTARFLVSGGARITVEPRTGASGRNLRLFLLGSAFGVLLHQRHLLPLHANAVEFDGKVVAFMGESGAGKSTLAAWFHDHGFPLIADDVAVVDFAAERPVIQPGLPRLRLWNSVIEAIGRDPEDYALSFEGEPSLDKRDVLLPPTKMAGQPLELGAIVELTRAAPPFEALNGAAAAEAVMAHTYRGHFVQTVQTVREHWSMCARLVQAVPVFRACVDFDLRQLDRSYAPLLDHVRQALAGAAI